MLDTILFIGIIPIIETYSSEISDVIIAILLIVLKGGCISFLILFSFAHFPCDVMTAFSVMFGFLSFLCIYY